MATELYKKRPYLYVDGEEIIDKMKKEDKGVISIEFMLGGVVIKYMDAKEMFIAKKDTVFENTISYAYDKHDIRLEVREHDV